MNKRPTYAGKITNKGQQSVDAVFPQSKENKAKVLKGGDLRARASKVKK